MKNVAIFTVGLLLSVLAATSSSVSDQRVESFERDLINLESAEIIVHGGPFVYNGSEIKPNITVKLGGKELLKGQDYDVDYSKNIEAGKGKIIVTGTGDGCTGTASTAFTISPRPIKKEDLQITCQKIYDGTTEADPLIKIENLISGDRIYLQAVSAAYEIPYVGTGINVTIPEIRIEGEDKENYVLPEGSIVVENGVITSSRPKISVSGDVPVGGATLDLMDPGSSFLCFT